VFDDVFKVPLNIATREHIINHLHGKVNRLQAIVDREQHKINRSASHNQPVVPLRTDTANDGIIAALLNSYEGPGEYRSRGPRHDNDFADIQDIRTAPTHDELTSRFPPFLPATLYNAPHPLPAGSMERLLDMQFRLLREELTCG
jgi:hypothetical protein